MAYKWGASVGVGVQPYGIAYGSGSLWVANYTSGTVSRVDPVALSVTATITGLATAEAITYAFGSVWVTHGNNVSRLDPSTNTITATITGMGSSSTDITFDGTYVWVQNYGNKTARRIDPTTNTVTGTFNEGNFGYGIATGSGSVWISAGGGTNTISRVDPSTLTASATISTTDYPIGLVFAFGSLWAATSGASTDVIRIDPATNTIINTITLSGAGSTPYYLEADSTAVWVAVTGTQRMERINPTTNTVTATLAPTGGVAPDGIGVDTTYNKVWVSYSSAINRIDQDAVGWVRGHAWG
jgi:DNA-binding beta-propeller fold protein YncE